PRGGGDHRRRRRRGARRRGRARRAVRAGGAPRRRRGGRPGRGRGQGRARPVAGADVAVDYRAEGWVERLRDELGDREPTLLLDGVGGPVARAVFDLLGPASRVVVFG